MSRSQTKFPLSCKNMSTAHCLWWVNEVRVIECQNQVASCHWNIEKIRFRWQWKWNLYTLLIIYQHGHPRIKSMSAWTLRISTPLDPGQTPIEEVGLRFWAGGIPVSASGLSAAVWRSESIAPSEASFFLLFVFEPPHMKLPTITWSHPSPFEPQKKRNLIHVFLSYWLMDQNHMPNTQA
jgi:hypothetical protein